MSLSRRDFLARSAGVVAATSFAQAAIAHAMQQAQQPAAGAAPQAPTWTPTFTPIRRNVGVYMGRGGAIGYLVDKGSVVVVDSQFPDSAKPCLDGLQERSKNRGVDLLINTHHHGDHTAGNIVFKGTAKRVLAHEKALEWHKQVASQPPRGGGPPAEQLFADTTLSTTWREQMGDEWVACKHYGRAHTSGDITITFERANVVHMGDLMFNRRHPVVDRPAGASMKNWISVLEAITKDHNNDTIYIFGHAGNVQPPATPPVMHPITGPRAEVLYFRDYMTALLAFVQAEMKNGKTKEEIAAIRTPLPKFEQHGNLAAAILNNAYDDIASGT